MGKYVIACIEKDIELLDLIYNKISRILDSDFIIDTYVNAEQALVGCYNHIITGNEILLTIVGDDISSYNCETFILQLYKHAPNTKNIIFEESLNVECIKHIINNASIYKIIPKRIDKIDLEFIILEAIKLHSHEKRLREYEQIIENAVEKRSKELHDINIKLQLLATTDSLSGVKNRRSFFESCGPMVQYNRREKQSLAILMIDIDRFKMINDMYGHKIGDEVIKLMANTTSHILRSSDIFARLGGEEFGAVLPNTSLRGAMTVAENIRAEIENLQYKTQNSETITFTVSIGVAMLHKEDADIDTVLHRADLALYEAKRSGRNKVVASSQDQ